MTEPREVKTPTLRRVVIAGLLVAFIGLCLANTIRELRRPSMASLLEPLPTPDLARSDPQVKQMIDQARAAVGTAPHNATLNRRLGMVYHAQKLLTEAAVCYRRAIKLAAEDFESHYYLARVDEDSGELDRAIDSAERAVALRPSSGPALTLLGRLYWTAGRDAGVEAITRRLLEGHPTVAAGHFYSGRLLAKRGALDEAVAAFETALGYSADSTQIHYAMAMALRKQGKVELADRHLQSYSNGRPTSLCPDPLGEQLHRLAAGANHEYEQALKRTAEGRLVEAVEHYRAALRIDPELAVAHQNLGVILLQTGQLQEAVHHLSQAVRIDPGLVPALTNLGTALARTGQSDQARQSFERARVLDPQNPAVFNDFANFLMSVGDLPAAVEEYRTAIRLAPADLPPRINLGRALQDAGRSAEAARVFAEALIDRPDDLQLIDLLARAWSDAGESAKAVEHLEAAIRRIGMHPALHYSLGNVLARSQSVEATLVRFSDSAAIESQAGAALLVGAEEALVMQKRYGDAIELLRRGLEVLPTEAEFMHRLAWLLSVVPQASLRSGSEAVILATEACRITRERFPPALLSLAVAHAEAGRFDQALGVAQSCLDLTSGSNRAAASQIEELMQRFAARQPFRLASGTDEPSESALPKGRSVPDD